MSTTLETLEAAAAYTRVTVGKGRYAPGRPATTTKPIRRYTSGMTVGCGWYCHYIYTDPAGSPARIMGWWPDGRVSVALTPGGCVVLGIEDVALVDAWPRGPGWDRLPEAWPQSLRNAFAALPRRSLIVGEDIVYAPEMAGCGAVAGEPVCKATR